MRFDWKTSDGEHREALAWRRESLGVLACVHGLSGCAEQFAPVAEALTGYSVYALELRGQGLDPVVERRAMVLDVEAQHRDITDFLQAIRERHPEEPVILMGESMGALLAASFAAGPAKRDIAALILSVPVVELIQPLPAWLRAVVRLIGRVFPRFKFYPSWFVSGETVTPPLTRDREYQDGMRAKPNHIRVFTLKFLSELGDLISESLTIAPKVSQPVLVLAAGHDCFVKVSQIERWFEKLGSGDKTLKIYPEAYHLLWHDFDRDRVLAGVSAWLQSRVTSTTQRPLPNEATGGTREPMEAAGIISSGSQQGNA